MTDPAAPASNPSTATATFAHGLPESLAAKLPEEVSREDFLRAATLIRQLLLLDAHRRMDEVKLLYHPWSSDNPSLAADNDPKAKKQREKAAKKRKAKRHKDLSAGWSSVSPSSNEGLRRLRHSLASMAESAGFSSITQEDLLTAMRENQVFEVELEVDWDRYEDVPVIFSRNRRIEKEEGRFIRDKLPGYMLRGSLGVFVIGLVLLALHFTLDKLVLPDGGISQVIGSATIEHAQTMGPGHRDEFRLDHDLEPGQSVRWEVFATGDDGEARPLSAYPDGSRGTVLPSSNPNRVAYQAPSVVSPKGFDLVLHWYLYGSDPAQPLNDRKSSYRVKAEAELPPIGSPLRTLTTILFWLGIGGVLAGGANLLRPLIRRLRKKETPAPLPSVRRAGMPRADRFVDLFRKECLQREVLGEVLVACKTTDSPYYQLSLYRDIPLADLETVLPSTRPRVRVFDGLMFVLQIAYGALLFLFRLVIILAATVVSFGLGAVIALFNAGGLATRSWSRFRSTVKQLASAVDHVLYRRTLGSSMAVIHALTDRLHTRESSSVLCLWANLLTAGPTNSADLLTRTRAANSSLTISEADIATLTRLSLATVDSAGHLVPASPHAALAALREQWSAQIA